MSDIQANDAAPSSTEPADAAGGNPTDNAGISAATTDTPNVAGGVSSAEQKPEVASASAAPAGEDAGEAGNVAAASASIPTLSTGDAASANGANLTSTLTENPAPDTGATTAMTSAMGEQGNADASAAENASGADSASSAQPASLSVATADRSVSASLVERARVSIDHLRAHLWTFEQSTVAHLHKDLDFVESLFK